MRLIDAAQALWLARLALWALGFLVAYQGQMLLEDRQHLSRAAVYMAVAIAFIVAATWSQPLESDVEPADGGGQGALRRRLRAAAVPLGLLFVALGLGIAFRTYLIGSQPFGVWFDEAQNGLIARDILDGEFPPIFIGGFTQLPSLFFYIFAGAFALMGDDILSLRLVSTLGGVLALPMIFLLARELFGWRVGVLALFFLAVMRWHVNFSRFGVTNIWASFFALAAIYFLVRGLRGKGWWNLVVAGIFTGLGPYAGFYFVFIPLVMVLFWLHSAVSHRALTLRGHMLAMVVVGVVAMVVYSPVGLWGLQHPDELTSRTNTASILKDKSRDEQIQAVLKSTKQHVLMFNSAGDGNGRHNLPGEPMLDTFTGIFFVLGIGISAARIRRAEYFLPLVWLALVLQGGIWSLDFEAPQAFRSSAVTPAVAMLAALPLGALWAMASGRSRAEPERDEATSRSRLSWLRWGRPGQQHARYLLQGAVALTVLFFLAQIAYRNFDTYFNQQLTRSNAWAAYSADATIVAREMKSLGTDPDYLLSTLFVGQPTLRFENPDYQTSNVAGFDWARDIPASGDGPTVYLLDATKEPFYLWLQELYPQGSFKAFTPPDVPNPIVAYEAVIPADVVQALHGLQATYTPAGSSSITEREAALDLDWSGGAPAALPLDAVWSGFLKVTEYRDYQLTLEAPGSLRLFLDDELLAEGENRIEVTRRLYKGEHELRVEARVERPGRVLLSWDGAPVPADAYYAYDLGGHGLLGTFYSNDNWEGEPILQELDPLVGFRYHAELPFASPFSTTWEGFLDVPVSGGYAFVLDARDSARLLIDGAEVLTTPYTLTEGRHAIEVRFLTVGGFPNIFVYWTPPGGERQIIPPRFLSPR